MIAKPKTPRFRVGIDIGGTFTDLCVLDEEAGDFFHLKVPSTPKDLTRGVMESVEAFLGEDRSPDDATFLFHATTAATNALLEQKGVDTWLVITEGFTGVYETPELGEILVGSYDYLSYPKPPLLVPQRKTIQIPERVDFRGHVVRPLDEAEARRRLSVLRDSGVEAVAVCLLFSFMNPEHERRIREMIRAVAPNADIYLSSETLPQIREYPRLATTVANAYVGPVVTRYIHRLEQALASRGLSRPLYIMQSNGGSLTSGALSKIPVQMIESGPAAGVLAAAHFGRLTGRERVISFDMGGTTAKAGIIEGGSPRIVPRFQAGPWLLSTPSLDIVEIGSGGGSIARIDKSGMLKVGPESAGAEPGPACYPGGGSAPTVTDADLALGWLDPDYFLGGKIRLDRSAAERAIAANVAEPLGLDVIAAASGIVKIVNSQMVEALRLVTVARGEDPREYVMVAFGGAGPVHAAAIAEELKIPMVIVPPLPGVTSAMGLLVSDLKRDYVQTRFADLEVVTAREVQALFETMEAEARDELGKEGIAQERIHYERSLDLRYSIQKYELGVPVGGGAVKETDKAGWRRHFDELHEQHYGSRAADQKVEIVNYRLTARVVLPKPRVPELPLSGEDPRGALKGRRRAYFDGWLDCPVYERERLQCGNRLAGPAIIEQVDSTIVMQPGHSARVDSYGNVIVEVMGERR
ncbi:MAG: hydantoinase/oxoprolinase family protein [Deltaproteobacteria bacterium]|nr:hydantoinase/oxoprolinase family protein [Deltaproteobacteria bacterium]